MSGSPRILIIRRDNIGDLACTTPLLEAMRARLPQAWLGALVTTYNADVLAGNPALDEVFVYEKLKHRTSGIFMHMKNRLGQMSQLRQRKLDCVLVPAPAPQSLKIARSLRPGQVIAAPLTFPAGMHEVERTFGLGRSLGVTGMPGPLRIFPDREKIREIAQGADAGPQGAGAGPQGVGAGPQGVGAGPFTAVHISARRPAQRWPLERYAALVARMSKQGRVMLLWAPGSQNNPGHPGDDEAAQRVLEMAGNPAVAAIATPDLRTLIAALSLADRVVCPDGGAMHLAAALGKPVVALFGDSPVERWRPWAVPYRVVRPESRDLADLLLEPVLEALRALA
jgi:ADP-heptose:LPS heptosyltransferase